MLVQSHAVRTWARDPQKAVAWSQQDVDVRQGDFNDSAALAVALNGVEGAFLMVPPFITPAAHEEMNNGLNSGWIHFGVPGTELVPAKVTPIEVFRQEKARPIHHSLVASDRANTLNSLGVH